MMRAPRIAASAVSLRRHHRAAIAARQASGRNFGVNLHSGSPIQREVAQTAGGGSEGLTWGRGAGMLAAAVPMRRHAEHLFRPLRLNGQVRAPIRGLPVFCPSQALAEACRTPPVLRQASAHLFSARLPVLHGRGLWAHCPATVNASTEGQETCGQEHFWRRCRFAGCWQPVVTPPASRSSMVAAQARSARSCWMPTRSPVLRSASPQTWSIASRIPADAEAAAAALIRRSSGAAFEIAQSPCPGLPRARRFAFRTTKEQGTAYV